MMESHIHSDQQETVVTDRGHDRSHSQTVRNNSHTNPASSEVKHLRMFIKSKFSNQLQNCQQIEIMFSSATKWPAIKNHVQLIYCHWFSQYHNDK